MLEVLDVKVLERLTEIWAGSDSPFLIHGDERLHFSDLRAASRPGLETVRAGDVVAVIGDFDPLSIFTLLRLIDLGAIIVPLTTETASDHDYFLAEAMVNVVLHGAESRRIDQRRNHPLVEQLRANGDSGLILFSTGTTGRPKAILHNLNLFLKRFQTPRPTLKALNFLLFDHIGGINTLLHTLFNRGVVVAPPARTVDAVLDSCALHGVEVLPTTPTFLRMMLMSGSIPSKIPGSLKVITYGTERMDQPTLDELCHLLPNVDFRQTFGMSELGILRVKSEARDSLFMRIGGEGVETKVVDGVLYIRSATRMLGYLNAPSPFDEDGWYSTKDIVECKGEGVYKVVGRTTDVINVGGLKFMASEVERVALTFPGVHLVKATARNNPITGQHVELQVEPVEEGGLDKTALLIHLRDSLQPHQIPKRINLGRIGVGHRFKKS
jgi:long-chain acyl-CoA synthetase